MQFDLVIVGASFAGLAAARTAASRGLSTAVIEAKPDVGARVRTSGILVREAIDEIDIPHHLTRRVPGVRLYSPSLKQRRPRSRRAMPSSPRARPISCAGWRTRRAMPAPMCSPPPASKAPAATATSSASPASTLPRASSSAPTAPARASPRPSACPPTAPSSPASKSNWSRTTRSTALPALLRRFPPGAGLHRLGGARTGLPSSSAWPCATATSRTSPASWRAPRRHFGWSRLKVIGRRSGLIPCGGPLRRIAAPGVLLDRRRRRLGVAGDRRRYPAGLPLWPPRRRPDRRPSVTAAARRRRSRLPAKSRRFRAKSAAPPRPRPRARRTC